MDGAIALTVAGGATPYGFDWNDNSLDGIEDPTGLAAGNYAVTVSDASGCMVNGSAGVTEPSPLSLSCAQQSPVTTAGGSDGVASITFGGGTGNYEYAWSGAASGSVANAPAGVATISNLPAGTYSLTLTDANGCTENCNFSITQPGCTLTLAGVASQNATCPGGSDGAIQVTSAAAACRLFLTGATTPRRAAKPQRLAGGQLFRHCDG
ncbi:MAG: SprB repeat-containing protein [Saprospiraceae bacterium]|nr:SprB repeat-containing protein [Saprospiraceae bacterium]